MEKLEVKTNLTDPRILQNIANALALMDASIAQYGRLNGTSKQDLAETSKAKAAKIEAAIQTQTGKTIKECRALVIGYTGRLG